MTFKKLPILILGAYILTVNTVNGQELLPEMYDSTLVDQQIVVNGGFLQHSSSLPNEITRKFAFGGEIAEEQSKAAYEKQNAYNRIGAGAHLRLTYKAGEQIFDSKPNWSWMINVANENHGAADYSGDFFGLTFLGNKAFLGESVNFSNSSAQFVQYLSVGGGIHDRRNKNFITLNAILPQEYFHLNVNKGNVAFSETGSKVDLRVQAELMEAAANPYFKGLGAAVNFDFNFSFGSAEKLNGIIKITGRNLGVYHINDARLSEIDTEKTYTGFQISDFTNDTEIASLKDTLGVRESNSSSTKLLPGFIQVGKVISANVDAKWQSFFGVRMYTNLIYRPMVYAGAHYQPIDSFSIGAQGSFGGYGNFRLGLYANYSYNNVSIGIGTEDVLGAFMKTQYGHSGLIRLAWEI